MLNCLKIVFGALLALALPAPAAAQQQSPQSIPAGQGTYQDLVQLFDEFLKWRDDVAIVGELSDSGAWRGIEDWSDRAVAARRTRMNEFLRRIADMNVAAWSRPQQAEYLAVRAKLDEQNFLLNVSKPWERDPGFYVDRMLAVTFVDLPLAGAKLESARRQLRGIPVLVQEAKRNLDNVAADYADLALHNLSAADGVGHGHPYRATPPAGVVGWYDDLLGRVSRQPELRDDVLRARSAVLDFQNWLKGNRPRMTAQAGVGEDNFNWYLKNVKLMPYTAHDIVLLGDARDRAQPEPETAGTPARRHGGRVSAPDPANGS
jgi:hypothetical protein